MESEVINSIRETYLKLHSETNQESVSNFLTQIHFSLEKDLDPFTADEIFSTVSLCFSRFPKIYLPFLAQFVDKYKVNGNYIILLASILFELTFNESNFDISSNLSFVDDCLNEIRPQITNEDKIIIFNHQIQPQFINDFILNLLLLSDLTNNLISDFFPYIVSKNLYLNNSKFELLLQKLKKAGYLQLTNFDDASKSDLIELLTNDFKITPQINVKALIFVSMSVLFTKSEGKMEINGLNEDLIIPFIAVTTIYHQKHQQKNQKIKLSFEKVNGLLSNALEKLDKNSSHVINISINIILNNLQYLYENSLLSSDFIRQIIITLLQKLISDDFFADKNLLLSILFNLSAYELCDPLKKFIETNQTELFNTIFSNLNEIKNSIHYSLNLKIFDSNLIIKHIENLSKTEDIAQIIDFVNNFCDNAPSIDLTQQNNEEQKEESLLNINEESEIDDILTYILSDPEPEDYYDPRFQILFKRMKKDKDMFRSFISYDTNYLYLKWKLSIPCILKVLLEEFEEEKDQLIESLNQIISYSEKYEILQLNHPIDSLSLPIPDFCFSIVSKLLNSIKENPDNYQAFLCLKNIAYYFPFIFFKETEMIFDVILKQLDNFELVFEHNLNEKSLNLIKLAYSASLFLNVLLTEPLIFDKFVVWLLDSILSFSNSQVFCFISVLLNFEDTLSEALIDEKIEKLSFMKIYKNLYERSFQNETFEFCYKDLLSKLILNISIRIINSINFKKNKPFKYQLYVKINDFYFQYFPKQICEFIFKSRPKKNRENPTKEQINEFTSRLNKNNDKPLYFHSDRINDINVRSFLIPLLKSYINLASSSLLDDRCISILTKVFNIYPNDENYLILILDAFSEYLNEFALQEIGSYSYISLNNMIKIFSAITDFKSIDEEILNHHINNFVNIILSPKWRNNLILLTNVSVFLSHFYLFPVCPLKLITNKVLNFNDMVFDCLMADFSKGYITHNNNYMRFIGNDINPKAKALYAYISIDLNENKITLNEANELFNKTIEYGNAFAMKQYISYHSCQSYLFNNSSYEEYFCHGPIPDLVISLCCDIFFDQDRRYKNKKLFGEEDYKSIWIKSLFYKKSAELGRVLSMYYYAELLDDYPKFFFNNAEKLKYYEKAAEKRYLNAENKILKTILSKYNTYKPKNLAKWLKIALDRGFKSAKYDLGFVLKTGKEYSESEKEEGEHLIEEAADEGNVKAMSFLHFEYMKRNGLLENSPERFENEAKKYKQILLDYKKDNNNVFVDKNFPAFKNWKRIDELYPAPLFQKDLIDPSFVNQGKIGNCFLISAFSRIAKQYYLVPLLFETKLPNEILGNVTNSINIKCGAVVIYFQAFGKKIPILIDTLIPVNKYNEVVESHPSDSTKSPWFSLVEKAMIKLYGTFSNLLGCNSNCIYSLFFYYVIYPISMKTFDEILEYQKEGCMMLAATHEKVLRNDLSARHAYSVLKARNYNGTNFLFLRNPWGKGEWKGDYSRESSLWTTELKKALNYDYYPPGAFWITYDDFSKYFYYFYAMEPLMPELNLKMFQYKLVPSEIDDIFIKLKYTNISIMKKFVIHITDKIQLGQKVPIYIIIERQRAIFTLGRDENGYMIMVKFKSDEEFQLKKASNKKVLTLLYNVTNNENIYLAINRFEKVNYVENFYITIACELNFEIYDEDEPDKLIPPTSNPGIVFENFTLSNPKLSKKLKLKIFNKKFVMFLDDENQAEEGDSLNTDRDEEIGNLFNYVNMDFSSSYIDINDLCLGALIGSGTYGNVYLVENKETNKQFAAKILKNSVKEIPVQFLSELKVLQSLRFPSIVKFIGFSDKSFNNENYPTIIIEYLKNGSLSDFLKDVFEGTKKLDNTKRMMILIGVALGIEYLHNHGIIHRDLKLNNILLDDDLNPKICDFGDSNILNFNIKDSKMVGTPLYMAPEVLKSQQQTFSSDVYSFGIISYYIYSNQIPNVNEIPDVSKLDSKYTNFVNDLLNEDPEKRPTFQQIVSSFLTEREKTWLEDVDEDEVDRYLHKFGLTIKPRNQKIDIDYINSITTEKYPNNAKQPKMTIEEIINNESISKNIKEDIKLAERYLTSVDKENIKQVKKLLFNVGYQFCMGDKEVTLNIQEDYFYAIKYLKAAALLGDKTSFYLLSMIFSNEQNQESQQIAFKLADISADLGCAHAFNILAVYYKNGIGIDSNIIMAAIYFKIAADKGIVSSMFQFANIFLKISQKEIGLTEFYNQLKIAKNIIQKIDGKSNKFYREIRYTLEAIENPNVALFVSEKYFEKAARNGNKEAEEIIKRINYDAKVSQNHPDFYDEICQTPSKSVIDETFDFDDQNW